MKKLLERRNWKNEIERNWDGGSNVGWCLEIHLNLNISRNASL